MRIKCGCPMLAFRCALSSSPKMGSGETDLQVPGQGILGRGGDRGPEVEGLERPRGGVSVRMALLWGRPLWWASGEEVTWSLVLGGCAWADNLS